MTLLNHLLSFTFSSYVKCHIALAIACTFMILLWRLAKQTFGDADDPSSIRYLDYWPKEMKINANVRNPFCFQVDTTKASVSGIKCVVKCDGACYIQALWGVPIYSLVELLHKDWLRIIHSVTTREPEGLSAKCKHAEKPILLTNNVEKVIEFQLPSDFNETLLSDDAIHSRIIYPFVLLKVLIMHGDESKYPEPYVIANASAVHLPDKALDKADIITQFIRLSSGQVGQMMKIYRSSPDDGRTPDSCLICYQKPASVVQLSCRHCCLCRECYRKCDKCPLCRNTYMDFLVMPDRVDNE